MNKNQVDRQPTEAEIKEEMKKHDAIAEVLVDKNASPEEQYRTHVQIQIQEEKRRVSEGYYD